MPDIWAASRAEFTARLKALNERLRPPPDLTVRQWADRYRKLSPESSAEPGQWSTARAPFQAGIMEAATDPSVRSIVVMKSSQVGASEILLNLLGYFIHQDPAPMLLVQPTLEMAQNFSKTRLAPMLRDTPALHGKVAPAKGKTGENTLLSKQFPAGNLDLAGANSPAGLASRVKRIALFDEVDRFPPSAGAEGDPILLGRKRTQTFYNALSVMVSTPTVMGASRVEDEFLKSDQRRYFVPCPHCGELDHFRMDSFDWTEAGTLEAPVWICGSCGGMATERDKARMVRMGRWIATAEGTQGAVGFHINQFASPWSSWAEIFQSYERDRHRPETFQTWVNTTLGECWEEPGEQIEAHELAQRAELYQAEAPAGVQVITAGVDVQKDRFEVSAWGWRADGEAWLIEHQVIMANTSRQSEFKKLDAYLTGRRFTWEGGGELAIAGAVVDAGYMTDLVYRYCAARFERHIYAAKGRAGSGLPLVSFVSRPRGTGPIPRRVFAVGVDTAKDRLMSDLQVTERGPGYIHFPADVTADYLDQLTAERRVIKYVRGVRTRVYEKRQDRNEGLDCRVYAHAALDIINVQWNRLEDRDQDAEASEPKPPEPTTPEPEATTKKSVDVLQQQIRQLQRSRRRSRFGARR